MPRHLIAVLCALGLLLTSTVGSAQDAPPPPPIDDTVDDPAPRTAPATRRTAARRSTAAAAQDSDGPLDTEPAVRAREKNMGMFFRFAGLATMLTTGNSLTTNGLLTHEIGMKFVFSEKLMLPVFFGFGVNLNSPEGDADSETDWQMSLGAGIEYHFRIWRRISPFLGGFMSFAFQDRTGEEDMIFKFGIGPEIGIEYYIADRVSLAVAYLFLIHITWQDNKGVVFQMNTTHEKTPASGTGMDASSGGRLTLTFYF